MVFKKDLLTLFFASFLLVIGFFSFPHRISAVTINITDFPSSITADSFNVTAFITGAATGTNYLRIDLYKDGTPNYFGETYNGSDWYAGSDGLQYFSISMIKGSTASATIQGRVANPSPTDFTGNGAYKLKLRRYTSSGSSTSTDVQSSVDVQIIIPTPTFTPTPTEKPAPTNTPAPTSTLTPTPIKTPTPSPTKTPSGTPSMKENLIDEKLSSVSGEILGESISDQPTNPISTEETAKVLGSKTNKTPLIFVILGIIIFFISCAILAFRIRKNGEKLNL